MTGSTMNLKLVPGKEKLPVSSSHLNQVMLSEKSLVSIECWYFNKFQCAAIVTVLAMINVGTLGEHVIIILN